MKIFMAELGLAEFHDGPVVGFKFIAVLLQMRIRSIIPVQLFDGVYMYPLSGQDKSGQKAKDTDTELSHYLSFTDSHSPG